MKAEDHYIESLNEFDLLVRTSTNLSQIIAGREVPIRLIYASKLFTRLVVNAVSLLRSVPHNSLVISQFEHWDFPSAASLARNFVETYHMFYYLTVDEISEEEEEFRFLLCELHGGVEKLRLYQELGVDAGELVELEVGISETRSKLKNNGFFQGLTEKQQLHWLKGRSECFLSHQEISEKIEFETAKFKVVYRFFSNQVHTSPFSFFRISENRGRGLKNDAEKNYITMALEFVSKYLSLAMNNIFKMFPDSKRQIEKTKLELINKHLTKGCT